MTTPRLEELINDPFLQTLSGRDDSTPLTLHQVAGLLQIAPETLRRRQRQGQVPPIWEDLRNVFQGLAKEPVWRVRLGSLRDVLAGLYASPMIVEAKPSAGRPPLPDKSLLDAASLTRDGGWHELPMKGGRRPRHASFSEFLASATIPTAEVHGPADVWLFMLVGEHRRPVDFFHSLDVGVLENDVAAWMTLEDYLTALRQSAIAEPDARHKKERLAQLMAQPSSLPGKSPPRS